MPKAVDVIMSDDFRSRTPLDNIRPEGIVDASEEPYDGSTVRPELYGIDPSERGVAAYFRGWVERVFGTK